MQRVEQDLWDVALSNGNLRNKGGYVGEGNSGSEMKVDIDLE